MLLRMNFKRTLYAENIEWETTTQTKGRRKGWDDEKKSDVPDNNENVYSQKKNNRKRDGNRTLTR